MNRKAVIMTALDFQKLDYEFRSTAVMVAFCGDYIMSGREISDNVPEIFYYPARETLCFWSDQRQLVFIAPDVSVKVVFKSLESTIERYQKAQDKIKQLVETNPAAFTP